ncbi:TPA: hypothetical protein QFK61_002054 [Enterococcus faecium]|jgi:hypothetical protein|uniref:Uncharacterized protein n=1 Tax=Enterococcus faecium TaxID=1352 RepID=A0A366TMM8_ENTFC|nr:MULTISPECIES: hypothetical protein [Enterococcus]EKU85064.1 hypothetical protein HMPREF9307_02275 [Enterococcus faecium FB129-CNAB4]MCC4053846.1 hypothetical protein [Enterococcus faecium]MDQ8460745.1 hypothetical protein [Enterococcus faecium]MDQ8465831.1 hypothetical protein [Enterococcus faecium]MDV4556788.1 hypothetical protein [Enterococcus faecium]
MAYVVKAMCYVDSEGNGVSDLKKAKRYDSKEMAELAAYVSNGEIVEIKTHSSKANKNNTSKHSKLTKEKQTKSNQAWMKKQ